MSCLVIMSCLQCLDDCTIAVMQPFYFDMGCEFSLEGLQDVSRKRNLSFVLCALSMNLCHIHPIQHQQKNVELCLDNDKKVNEDSKGGLSGCASGSNFGNPCEVTFYVPVTPSCSALFLFPC